jgi:hypothetical protein
MKVRRYEVSEEYCWAITWAEAAVILRRWVAVCWHPYLNWTHLYIHIVDLCVLNSHLGRAFPEGNSCVSRRGSVCIYGTSGVPREDVRSEWPWSRGWESCGNRQQDKSFETSWRNVTDRINYIGHVVQRTLPISIRLPAQIWTRQLTDTSPYPYLCAHLSDVVFMYWNIFRLFHIPHSTFLGRAEHLVLPEPNKCLGTNINHWSRRERRSERPCDLNQHCLESKGRRRWELADSDCFFIMRKTNPR